MPFLEFIRKRSRAGEQSDHPLKEFFSEPPRLESERLLLRKMTVEDAQDMYDYSKRSEVTRYLLWDPHPDLSFTEQYLRSVQEKYRTGDFCDWAIELRSAHRMIGTCGLTSVDWDNHCGEVGYVVHPQYWGMGLAAEALDSVLAFGFDRMHFHRMEARYLIGNDRSRRVMEKCGMHYEGTLRHAILRHGVYCDVGICSILHDEFQIGRAIRMAEQNSAVVIEPETVKTVL